MSFRAERRPEVRRARLTSAITGGNSGIGLEAAGPRCAAGRLVILACRDPARRWPRPPPRCAPRESGAPWSMSWCNEPGLAGLHRAGRRGPAAPPRAGRRCFSSNNAGVMGSARAHHRRRVRDAVRHQPPRPLRLHRAVLAAGAGAARAGGDRQQPAHLARPRRLRGTSPPAAYDEGQAVQHEQAGQRPRRLRGSTGALEPPGTPTSSRWPATLATRRLTCRLPSP